MYNICIYLCIKIYLKIYKYIYKYNFFIHKFSLHWFEVPFPYKIKFHICLESDRVCSLTTVKLRCKEIARKSPKCLETKQHSNLRGGGAGWGTCLAHSQEPVTLDLRVRSSSPMLGVEST